MVYTTLEYAALPPVVVFAGGGRATEQQMRGAIRQLGYDVADPPEAADSGRTCIGVLLAEGDDVAMRRWLHDLGRRVQRLLIVVPRGLRIDTDLFRRHDDVIFEPFPQAELDLRLRRLAAALPVAPAENVIAGEAAGMVGEAPAYLEALHAIHTLGASDVTVLIEGETGTGKELAGRALHRVSARHAAAFVPVNCAALPDGMLENELFGHRAGAFTDARASAQGLVDQAEAGTLFLDEVDALTPHAQAVLLRFVQNKEYRRLGGDMLRQADVRVVAAANTPLRQLIAERRFRADLFFRLDVGRIVMPPLRLRTGDARRLAEYFLALISARGPRRLRFAPAMLDWIEAQPWPGNVRELQSFVERQALFTEQDEIGPPHAPACPTAAPESLRQVKAAAVRAAEADFIRRVMCDCGGNVSAAARRAGTERRAFGRLLKKHGFDRNSFLPQSGR
jgi:DNA-binding NtrC family response regulator